MVLRAQKRNGTTWGMKRAQGRAPDPVAARLRARILKKLLSVPGGVRPGELHALFHASKEGNYLAQLTHLRLDMLIVHRQDGLWQAVRPGEPAPPALTRRVGSSVQLTPEAREKLAKRVIDFLAKDTKYPYSPHEIAHGLKARVPNIVPVLAALAREGRLLKVAPALYSVRPSEL